MTGGVPYICSTISATGRHLHDMRTCTRMHARTHVGMHTHFIYPMLTPVHNNERTERQLLKTQSLSMRTRFYLPETMIDTWKMGQSQLTTDQVMYALFFIYVK